MCEKVSEDVHLQNIFHSESVSLKSFTTSFLNTDFTTLLTSLQNILEIVASESDNKNIFAFEKLDQKIKQKSLTISEKYVRNTENFHKNNKFFNFKGERLSDFDEIEFEEEFGLYFEEIGVQFSKIQKSVEFSVVKMAFQGQEDFNLNLKFRLKS